MNFLHPFENADGDKLREECGVFGVYGQPEASTLAYLGLYALQHRGQESAGIAVARDDAIYAHRGMGLVPDVFALIGRAEVAQVDHHAVGDDLGARAGRAQQRPGRQADEGIAPADRAALSEILNRRGRNGGRDQREPRTPAPQPATSMFFMCKFMKC